MTESRRIDGSNDVVLYHGSLDELNSRGNAKYIFAKQQSWSSREVPNKENWDLAVSADLRSAGFDGLVNRRTAYVYKGEDVPGYGYGAVVVEGTPVHRR